MKTNQKIIEVGTNAGRIKGRLIKNNALTVIVRLPDGNVIKRHKVKHAVIFN